MHYYQTTEEKQIDNYMVPINHNLRVVVHVKPKDSPVDWIRIVNVSEYYKWLNYQGIIAKHTLLRVGETCSVCFVFENSVYASAFKLMFK